MKLGKFIPLAFISTTIVFSYVSICEGAFLDNENLILQISTDKTSYIVGEPILISLSLFNPTEDAITLTFRASKVFDGSVGIYSVDGEFFEKIYDSKDCAFLPVITVLEIEPFASAEILNLNYSSSSLETGKYIVEAVSGEFVSETTIEVYLSTMPEFSHFSVGLVIALLTLLFVSLGRKHQIIK